MDFKINDQSVDFTLQDETMLSHLLASVAQWAGQRDLIVTQIEADGEAFSPESLTDKPIADTAAVNFTILPRADVALSALEDGIDYCVKAAKAAGGDFTAEDFGNATDGINWLKSVINSGLNILSVDKATFTFNGKPLQYYLDALDTASESLASGCVPENLTDVFGQTKDLFIRLISGEEMQRLAAGSAITPDILLENIASLKQAVPHQIQNLEDSATAFQTGKDKDGSLGLQSFTDFMLLYLETCYETARICDVSLENIITNGESLADKNERLQEFLNEAKDVLENQDFISLADVLEYEIKPALETIVLFLDLLANMLQDAAEG